ncbi:MAG: ABC transporter ATP-binding protein [Patescibacteria group bacterium]|nr:ABC transporter ATP-binding protein [Patescibacteria group bacterium]
MALLEVENLVKTYAEGKLQTPVLRGVSFRVETGEFLAIMGPSGSGKSTLLHILGFLDRQSSGSYRFDGKRLDDHSSVALARIRNRQMGFVFQSFNLLPRMDVYGNVRLPLMYSAYPEAQWDALTREAITAVGLEHRLRYDVNQLSGGERQRVAVARALVVKPRVIFADEPTGNLDTKSGRAVMDILQHLNEEHEHTIVLITHETSTAEYARRVIRVCDGQIESDRLVVNRRTGDGYRK